MYRKSPKGWLKHWDFILLDICCLQLAFLAAYVIRHGIANPYTNTRYRNVVIALVLIQIFVIFFGESFKSVLRRGYYNEFVAAAKLVVMVTLVSTFYLFLVQAGGAYSRMTMILTGVFYFLFCYPARLVLKKVLREKQKLRRGKRSLVILTTREKAEESIRNIAANTYDDLRLSGIAVMDDDMTGEKILDVEVVACRDTIVEYVCRQWVDEVYIDLPEVGRLSEDVLEAFNKMGVTEHFCLTRASDMHNRKQRVEKMGGMTVLTTSVNMVSSKQLFYKRALDICGSLAGCVITAVLFVFVAPAICIMSPGPVFFTQIRVGQNGRKFKMYKFRSMYVDAEERKKELMEANRCKDGHMFKMEDDPRIIKGIGHFIRRHSIDEFPQFFNVLKGDMSLVGTRPPTLDEWEKYDLHHRIRLAAKPGITGLWQVSGRSRITDFEEVVKLDQQYIENWTIGLDVKILFKTVKEVVKSGGGM